jgi:hypothetical protein
MDQQGKRSAVAIAAAAAWLSCAGCMFQQTSTVEIRAVDSNRVAVHDQKDRAVLPEGADASEPLLVTREHIWSPRRAADADQSRPVRVVRDEGAIRLDWSNAPDVLVSESGMMHAGRGEPLELPNLDARALVLHARSIDFTGPCVPHTGRRGGRIWECLGREWNGALVTPWSNVASVKRYVVPIDHAWASFDLVVGTVLTAVGTGFMLPPHNRRGATEDVAIGLTLSVPGVVALVNGIGILMRSPYHEEWTPSQGHGPPSSSP